MKNQNTDLKCTWTNGLIWAVITAVAALGIRYALWYFVMWQGDPKIYFDEFASLACALMLVATIFPILFYLLSYWGYMRLAAVHPEDLRGVAMGKHGKPWVPQLILLLVTDFVWTVACLITVSIALGMDLSMRNDMTAVMTLCFLNAGGWVLDLVLFILGNKLLLPDLVNNNKE